MHREAGMSPERSQAVQFVVEAVCELTYSFDR